MTMKYVDPPEKVLSITNNSERLIEKENGKFYATDYTGYVVTTIDNKFDFPLINCIEKLYEYEELEEKGLLKRIDIEQSKIHL